MAERVLVLLILLTLGIGRAQEPEVEAQLRAGQVVGVEVGTKQVLWKRPLGMAHPVLGYQGPGLYPKNIQVFDYYPDSRLLVFSWPKGKLLWQYELRGSVVESTLYDQITLYRRLPSGDSEAINGSKSTVSLVNSLTLLNQQRQPIWKAPWEAGLARAEVVGDKLVVVVARWGDHIPYLYLRLSDGRLLEKGSDSTRSAGFPSADLAYLARANDLFLAHDGTLSRFDYQRGRVARVRLSYPVNLLSQAGDLLLASRQYGNFSAYQPDTLRLLWNSKAEAGQYHKFQLFENTLLLSTFFSGAITCNRTSGINRQTGEEMWRNYDGVQIAYTLGFFVYAASVVAPGCERPEFTEPIGQPIFDVYSARDGKTKTLRPIIKARPNCGTLQYSSRAYKVDSQWIYVERKDNCGRFVTKVPWR